MPHLRLLGRKTSSNVQKVAWLLSEMQIPFEREDVGGVHGGNDTPHFLGLNPTGRIPTLIDGTTVVWESNTILRYIATTRGPTPFYPQEPVARSSCERWMDWQLGTLTPSTTPLLALLVRTPPESRDDNAVQRHAERARELFGVLDGQLASQAWVAGDRMSLADICLGILAYRWFELDVDRGPKKDNLERWYLELAAQPHFKTHVMIGLS